MSDLRQLVRMHVTLLPTWGFIPVMPQEQPWAAEVCARLCPDPAGAADLARRVESVHNDMLGGEQWIQIAIWVPDPNVPSAQGAMFANLMVKGDGPDVTRENYRRLTDPAPKRSGVQVFQRKVVEDELPAGPALLAREVIARREGRFSLRSTTHANAIWTVFPPGSCDAVQLTFTTEVMELADQMFEEADTMALSLMVWREGEL